ncbi:MAG TPA: radical SAM protein, partial [Methanomassiliicoccales archaeon]|nr:radical SAM protein [Methanomassiliicoccales archaeon]
RDIDLLKRADKAEVGITITTIDDEAARRVERGAPSPRRRLDAVRRLVSEGVNTYVLIGPVLPTVTDRDLGSFMDALARTGVRRIMTDRLRLRSGMLEALAEALESEPGGKGFDYLASSASYLEGLVKEVETIAREHDLRTESAF